MQFEVSCEHRLRSEDVATAGRVGGEKADGKRSWCKVETP
jgi:hypothetical protein